MRFLIASSLCILLVVMGCYSPKPSGESRETPAPNHVAVSDSSAAAGENGNDSRHVERGTTGAEPAPIQTDDTLAADNPAMEASKQASPQAFDWGNINPTDYGWTDEGIQRMKVVASLLLTDLDAARAELTEVANIRFGKHPLADEWSELFFRLFRDQKANVLETKRWLELEIQLLTTVDAETHAKAIQEYQVGLTQLELLIQLIKSQGDEPGSIEAEFTPFNPSKEGD